MVAERCLQLCNRGECQGEECVHRCIVGTVILFHRAADMTVKTGLPFVEVPVLAFLAALEKLLFVVQLGGESGDDGTRGRHHFLGKRTVARVQQIFLQLGDENCGEGRDRDRNDGG